MKGISAVIATLLLLVITIGLAMTVYFYVNNMASRQTAKVVDVQPYCTLQGTTYIITLVITNIGTDPIVTGDLKYILNSGAANNINLGATPLNPRSTTTVNINAQQGANTLILITPSGSTRLSVFC